MRRGKIIRKKAGGKKKIASTIQAKSREDKSAQYNRSALWKAYRELQEKANHAWEKFRGDVKKNAKSDILIQDQSQLLLLLGECNYMARECMRMAGWKKSFRK